MVIGGNKPWRYGWSRCHPAKHRTTSLIRVVSDVPMIAGCAVAYGADSRDSTGARQAATLTDLPLAYNQKLSCRSETRRGWRRSAAADLLCWRPLTSRDGPRIRRSDRDVARVRGAHT